MCDCTTAETVGEAYWVSYIDRAEAECEAASLREDLTDTDLRQDTAYSVVEHGAEIILDVGSVTEYDGDDDEADDHRSSLQAYIEVAVKIDGTDYTIGCMVGVPESQHGTVRAGGHISPTAWTIDESDLQVVPEFLREAVLGLLNDAAPKMWSVVESDREPSPPYKLDADMMGPEFCGACSDLHAFIPHLSEATGRSGSAFVVERHISQTEGAEVPSEQEWNEALEAFVAARPDLWETP